VLLAAPFKFKSNYENKSENSCGLKHPWGEIQYRSEKHDQGGGKFAALHIRYDTALLYCSICRPVLLQRNRPYGLLHRVVVTVDSADDETLIYWVERNGDGGDKVKLYLPLSYTTPPNQDSPLNGIKMFHVVSMERKSN